MKVLIVDDDESIRLLLRRMATRSQMKSYEAADGVEAVDILERKGHKIQAVITDADMPRMDGFELLDHISQRFPQMICALHSGREGVSHPRADLIRIKPQGFNLMNELKAMTKDSNHN